MPMIRECIVTTLSEEGSVHIAPLGLIVEEGGFIIAPFRPSATLDNLRVTPYTVANFTDDVLVFAGCLTGRKDWPTRPSTHVSPGSSAASPSTPPCSQRDICSTDAGRSASLVRPSRSPLLTA